jgi:hypothetical protein
LQRWSRVVVVGLEGKKEEEMEAAPPYVANS